MTLIEGKTIIINTLVFFILLLLLFVFFNSIENNKLISLMFLWTSSLKVRFLRLFVVFTFTTVPIVSGLIFFPTCALTLFDENTNKKCEPVPIFQSFSSGISQGYRFYYQGKLCKGVRQKKNVPSQFIS